MNLRPEAEADLASARDWYDQQRDGLGEEFLEAVQVTLGHIEATPTMHAPIYKDVRRGFVRRFPYLIFYRILDDGVEVVGVVHNRRHPKTWQSRV